MKIIFGAVYRRRNCDNRNDQHYYCYIPVAIKDKNGTLSYRMVDTYETPRPSSRVNETEYETKIRFLEQANCGETSWSIFYGSSNYYYQNHYSLNSLELDENEWEMIADLHEYKIVSDDEAREYLEEDLLMCIPLWHEDSFRWSNGCVGRCFVKKDAKKDGWKIYSKCLDDNDFHFTSDYRLNTLEKTCKDVLANMKLGYGKKKEIKKTLKKIRKYKKLSKEYDEFCKNLIKKEKENKI